MRSLSWRATAAIAGGALLLTPQRVAASDAIWIQPSAKWYGIDGTWSTFSFGVGTPMQFVDLHVSTTLSETWMVSTGGCGPSPLCSAARGGLFNASASSSWNAYGGYELGLSYISKGAGGIYGTDSMAWVNTITSTATKVDGALIAAINSTDYYQGYIGVGTNSVQLGSNVESAIIAQLAEKYGSIPSHSYGYTAGAYYAGNNGTVGSLVLGGYDSLRFNPHDVVFSLDSNSRVPSVLLRGITVTVPSLDKAPVSNWNSTTQTLVTMKDTVTAVIDTSTPYLWMPQAVCDRFATAFNLTWSEDFGVYLFPNGAAYTKFKEDTSMTITFTLTSFENLDNFGQPLNVPGAVNITINPAAFAQTLSYPFKNNIAYGAPSVPYFPLKPQNTSDSRQYVLGRAFMQEAYIKMNYDLDVFSVYQALFPDNAAKNYSAVNMERPDNSAYAPFSGPSHKGLTTGQIVGAVIGAFGTGIVIGLLAWLCCRRRRRAKQPEVDLDKAETESMDDELPRSPVRRMFSIMIGRRRSRRPAANEVHGDSAAPAEVGADASHAVYELPVPIEPVELDSTHYGSDDVTDLGTEGTDGMSSYDLARRKMDRQIQGPVPAYSPPMMDQEKNMQDVSPVPHYRPSDEPSPTSSPTYTSNTNSNSLPDFLPSPITPFPADGTRHFDFPSPMVVLPPLPSPVSPRFPSGSSDPSSGTCSLPSPDSPSFPQPTYEPSSVSRSNSSNASPTSPSGPSIPAASYQRTPIDPSRVVCLGPLPENVQLQVPQTSQPIPRLVTPDGRTIIPTPNGGDGRMTPSPPDSPVRPRMGSIDSLGSNFTVDEEQRIHTGVTRQQSVRQAEDADGDSYPRSPRSMERIDAASELVHVPQVADKRYSWEEERK